MRENENEESGFQEAGAQDGGEAALGADAQAGEAAASGEGAPSDNEASPEEKIAALEAQLADARDQYLRKAAEFENFRKRMNAEKQGAIDYANQSLLQDLIPVIDDFERAIKAGVIQKPDEVAPDEPQAKMHWLNEKFWYGIVEGVSMIEKRLSSQLENKWGLKRFDSAGEPFDPNRHEAIMMEKSPDAAEAVVKEDLIKGYTLKDRVIRAAKVKVLMPEGA